MRPALFQDTMGGGDGPPGMDRVVQGLTEDRQVDRVLFNRRILDVAESGIRGF